MGLRAQADTIADWAFETNTTGSFTGATAGPYAPDIGNGSASASHANSGTFSMPAGNGSSHSFSATSWSVNDYFQFQVSTVNLGDIQFAWNQNSSATGPSSFQLEYSLTGANGSFTTISAYTITSVTWSAGTPVATSDFTQDLSALTAIDNQATVYFRLVDVSTTAANGNTVGSAGTDRVDNVVVTGSAVPEPSAWMLGGIALGAVALLRLRRRSA